MNRSKFLLLGACVALSAVTKAQLSLSATGVPAVETFTTYTGSGLVSIPTTGELDSDTWRILGMSDGDTEFGANETGGDYAKGESAGGVTAGGLYAFDAGLASGVCLGVQPTGSDFTPGSVVLKIQNNTGAEMTAMQLAYDIILLNNATRSSSLNVAYSFDDAAYTSLSALDFSTPEADDANGWVSESKSLLIPLSASLANGDFIYVKWSSEEVSGSGSRDEFGIDNVSITSVEAGNDPIVSFDVANMDVFENQTNFDIVVNIDGSYDSQTTVQVALNGGSATNNNDYFFVDPATVIFPANDDASQTITVLINDDSDDEGTEDIMFELQNATNNATIANGNLSVNILDDDKFIPTYNVNEINSTDVNGVADSAGVYCRLEGVVFGVNLRTSGLQFFFNDNTGGIQVFNGASDLGYSVSHGDSVRIVGAVSQFNGQLQISPDSIVSFGAAEKLPEIKTELTSISEAQEGDVVQINCIFINNEGDWTTGDGNGFNVGMYSADGDFAFDVRIDDQVELFNENVPYFTFNIIGVVGQYDNSEPYTEGYQLFAFNSEHIADTLLAAFESEITGKSVQFSSLSTGATSFNWEFGDFNSSQDENPLYVYSEDETYSVILGVENEYGCLNETADQIIINTNSINEHKVFDWNLFPSVVEDELFVTHDLKTVEAFCFNSIGKLMLQKKMNEKEFSINVTEFPTGVYYFRICGDGDCSTRKWIKK